MEAIKTVTLARVENMLKAIGAQYAIVVDGEKRGTLEVAEPKGALRRTKLYDFEGELRYVAELKAMNPGDIKKWKVPTNRPEYADRFYDTVGSWCNRYWGRDTFVRTIEVSGDVATISVLRG